MEFLIFGVIILLLALVGFAAKNDDTLTDIKKILEEEKENENNGKF